MILRKLRKLCFHNLYIFFLTVNPKFRCCRNHYIQNKSQEGVVTVDLTLNIEFGKNILEVSKKVQDKVKSSIENMTGLEVADVNIRIAGVDMENGKGK